MTGRPRLRPGAYYHIYNRGNNGENLFREERNYPYFLQLYTRHVKPVAETYAYCLLKNHFHALVRIKNEAVIPTDAPPPCQAFSNLFSADSTAINKAYARTGSLFEHPFGRIEVNDNVYLCRLVTYIHHNPQRHGLVDDFHIWKHSSYHALIANSATRLKRETVMGWFDNLDNFTAVHERVNSEPAIEPLVPDTFD